MGQGEGRLTRRRRRWFRSAGKVFHSQRWVRSCPSQNIQPTGAKVAGEHPDLSDIRLSHRLFSSSFGYGKMPCSAMQKDSVRKGCMLQSAPCDPPTSSHHAGSQGHQTRRSSRDRAAGCSGGIPGFPQARLRLPAAGVTFTACVCAGNSALVSVCACSPPVSPSGCPLPTWIGTSPLRVGKREIRRPVPAERRSERREERLILR